MNVSNDNNAASVDETVTTTEGDDESVRADYPPEQPVGVEDPSRRADGSIAPDDAVTRAWRHEGSDHDTRDVGGAGHG